MLKKLIHKIHQFNETKIKWYKDIYFIPLLLFILFLDQSTKFLVKNNLDLYQSWPSEGFFRITHGINTGIAFGLLENQSIILITVLPIIAIVFLIYYYKKQVQSNRLIRIIFGLQLGGAFGNIIDRILLGSVVDFIDIGPWYIFNIADSSIVCGLILLIFFIVIQEQQYKNSTQSAQKK
ncbi:MAG: signal peptidase II [Dehalococcoidia bacterium]